MSARTDDIEVQSICGERSNRADRGGGAFAAPGSALDIGSLLYWLAAVCGWSALFFGGDEHQPVCGSASGRGIAGFGRSVSVDESVASAIHGQSVAADWRRRGMGQLRIV